MATVIHPTAIIYPGVRLGADVYVGPCAVIGAPPEHSSRRFEDGAFECFPAGVVTDGFPESVIIGDRARIRAHVTIDAPMDAGGRTIIGADCMLMAGCHVGHDAQIGDRVTLCDGCQIGGFARVGDGANIGLNAVLHQRATVGRLAMVGAGAMVTERHPVPDHWIARNRVGKGGDVYAQPCRPNVVGLERAGWSPERIAMLARPAKGYDGDGIEVRR